MNIKTLTKDYKYLMRDFHANFGFDFEKPYEFTHITGKFTMRQIQPKDSSMLTVILIKGVSIFDSNWLHLVLYAPTENGSFSIDVPNSRHCNSYDRFYRKSDFIVARKNNIDAYVLSQAINHTNKKNGVDFDEHARYKVKCCYGELTDKTNSSSCDFIPYGFNGEPIHCGLRYVGLIGDVIDKSGYFTCFNRNRLAQDAKAIRDAKNKKAYDAQDNTDKLETLAKLVDKYKHEIADAVIDAKTYDDVKDIPFGWLGLATVLDGYNTFVDRTTNKEYKSIEQSNDAYYDLLGVIYRWLNKRKYD